MQPGQVAIWLTAVVAVLVAVIGAAVQIYNARYGTLLTRRTEIDKMYLGRLQQEEAQCQKLQDENDELREKLQETREKLLAAIGARELLTLSEERVTILQRRLKQHGINHEDDIIQ